MLGRSVRALVGSVLAALVAAGAGCADPTDLTSIQLTADDDLVVQILPPSPPRPSAPAVVQAGRVSGDRLMLDIAYAGGCAAHRFALIHDGQRGLSLPAYVSLYLVHDDRGDRCEALIARRLTVDLRPLRDTSPPGTLLLRVLEPDGSPANLGDLQYRY